MATRILIVEDSRTEAMRARLILERAGYQISLASDGKEGLNKATEEKPDLILLDALMPKMSGFEACGKLKIDPKTTHIPIIMMVCNGEASDMPSGPGLDCFLTKPYEPALLITKVKSVAETRPDPFVEIARYKEELNRARQETQSANKARSEFLANMSHELRTPLHEIMGMTELVLGTHLDTEQEKYITTAKASSNALLSLINDVIEFSELEAGQLGLEEKPFELSEPIDRTIEIMSPRAADKGLALTTTLAAQVQVLRRRRESSAPGAREPGRERDQVHRPRSSVRARGRRSGARTRCRTPFPRERHRRGHPRRSPRNYL